MNDSIIKTHTLAAGRNNVNKMESKDDIPFKKFKTLNENENRLKLETTLRVILEEKDKAMESLDYLDYLDELGEINSMSSNYNYSVFEILSSAFNSSANISSSSSESSSNM